MIKADMLEKLRAGFREEARDLLAELDEAILALEARPDDRELIGRIFRAIHTIKGSGSTAGLKEIAAFTHKVEEVFNEAREGRLRITPQITDLTLQACDLIGKLLESEQPQAYAPEMSALLAKLAPLSSNPPPSTASGAQPHSGPAHPARKRFSICFRPNEEIFYSGNDPLNVLAELASLGDCQLKALVSAVPLLDSLEPEKCYLAWEIELVTDQPETQVKEVFAFVEEGSRLAIEVSELNEAFILHNGTTFPAESLREFFAEGQEQLAGVEEALLGLEERRQSADLINVIFRGLHNLKGNAGVLLSEKTQPIPPQHPLFYIQRVGHAAESLVQAWRTAEPAVIGDEQIELLFAAFDLLKHQVAAFAQQRMEPVASSELLRKLGLDPGGFVSAARSPQPAAQEEEWVLFFQTAAQCQEAMNSALKLAASEPAASRSAAKAYLRSAKTFLAAARFQELAGGLADLLQQQVARLEPAVAAKQDLPAAAWSALAAEAPALSRGLRELSPDAPPAQGSVAAQPAKRDSAPRTSPGPNAHSSIRVDQEKLEKLMRVAGELLVARSILPVLAGKVAALEQQSGLAKEVRDAGAQISRIANELQSTVMAIRMLPLRTVFQKFPRMVRDLARAMGKQINFVTQGDDTELDKTVLEQIGDPLIHLVRNAVDHGIEPPEARKALGKPPQGEVKILARNEGTQVVIQIVDDGKGLDAELLKRKAVEKGILSPDQAGSMTVAQAYQLIFAAGFSTAEKVTDVSGRGVGMDVVRTNLNQLHGTIAIDTVHQRGTTFTIKLPTSLMVSKGVLLQAGGQEFILPMDHARDLVKLPRRNIHTFKNQKIAQVRGQVYPLAFLGDVLASPREARPPQEETRARLEQEECSVAIIQTTERHYGLVVDRFVSEVEVIIKPLTDTLGDLRTYLGAAIMGDGRLVLVLNPAELLDPHADLAA